MNRILSVFAVGFIIYTLVTGLNKDGKASTPTGEEHGLTLSDMQVKITSQGHGDVFMLYKDFYAGDEMHRLGINLTGIEEIAGMSGSARIEKSEPNELETKTAMHISMKANGKTTVFELNNSPAARDLYTQLPLSTTVENYSNNEKIFYPPKKLNTTDTPQADSGRAGTLAYYAPWGDVVMFYSSFSPAPGLYELGHVISGKDYIQGMSGNIQIEKGSNWNVE